MNIYEAIFVRKTNRHFLQDPIAPQQLQNLQKTYDQLTSLFGAIETEMEIVDNRTAHLIKTGFRGVKAPYFLLFYTEDAPKSKLNVGCLMQQMALHLTAAGYGNCFVTDLKVSRDRPAKESRILAGALAFGKTREEILRKAGQAKRLSLSDLCNCKEQPRKWMEQLLEAARMAPSYANDQPWRFVIYDNRIHIFLKKQRSIKLEEMEEVNAGVMLANVLVAAEELWLDIDLVKQADLSKKDSDRKQYVLSIQMIR